MQVIDAAPSTCTIKSDHDVFFEDVEEAEHLMNKSGIVDELGLEFFKVGNVQAVSFE